MLKALFTTKESRMATSYEIIFFFINLNFNLEKRDFVLILVAGGTGLVGSALVEHFSKREYTVVGTGRSQLNLLEREETFNYIRKLNPDVVINAAATVGGVGANNSYPVNFLSENLQMQVNLMDALHQYRTKRFIFLGSSCIYPRICPQPILEDYLMTSELEPTNSAYAIAKISGIELVKAYRKQYGHSWISLMPANLYGNHDNFSLENSHVLPALIRKFVEAKRNSHPYVTLWGDGSALREFLHASDLARAVDLAMSRYDEDRHINIGSGSEISIKELANRIVEIVGYTGEIRWDHSKPNGTPRKILDSSRIRALGWNPEVSLENGISDVVNWFSRNLDEPGGIRL